MLHELANWTIQDWGSLFTVVTVISTAIYGTGHWIAKHSDFNVSLKENTAATNNLTKSMGTIQTHLNNVDVRLQSHEDSIQDHEYRIGRLEGTTGIAKKGDSEE